MRIRVNVENVPINLIDPNPWNPNVQTDFMYDKEKQSIQEHGFLDPIDCREVNGRYQIIDGEHRFKGAKDLGYDMIPINNLGEVPDHIAMQLTVIRNETRGRPDQDRLGKLLRDLQQMQPPEELLRVLPYTQSEIDQLTAHASVDWDEISPSLNQPTVVGEGVPVQNLPPGEKPEPNTAAPAPRDPHAPLKRTFSVELPEEVFTELEETLDNVTAILFPHAEPGDQIDRVAPIQALLEVLRHIDLDTALTKDSEGLDRGGDDAET